MIKTVNQDQNKATIPSKLVDTFGREHNYLRISLTERCNLRCFYCMPEEGVPLRDKACFMSHEEVIEIASTFTKLGVNKIRLTGGEPLIKKGAKDIISNLGSLNTELAITTNGILIDQFINCFKQAGIQSVNVSLDSLDAKRQTKISRRNYFDRIINNIDLLLEENFKVKVNVVVMKNINHRELVDFVELTQNKPLEIRFIEFMPFQGNKWDWAKGMGFDAIMNQLTEHYGNSNIFSLKGKANDTAKCFKVNHYRGSFGIISSVTHPFCNSCNRIRLTADGKIRNCLFSPNETDLLRAYRNGDDIIPLILQSITAKKAQRAGLNSLNDLNIQCHTTNNRSMVTIGG